jgi:hypothetical protein
MSQWDELELSCNLVVQYLELIGWWCHEIAHFYDMPRMSMIIIRSEGEGLIGGGMI